MAGRAYSRGAAPSKVEPEISKLVSTPANSPACAALWFPRAKAVGGNAWTGLVSSQPFFGCTAGGWAGFAGRRGGVRYLVLDAVSARARHGDEIISVIEEKSRGAYRPSPGIVYPTLQMLGELQHVRSVEVDGLKSPRSRVVA